MFSAEQEGSSSNAFLTFIDLPISNLIKDTRNPG
jgi:hypothetical protein